MKIMTIFGTRPEGIKMAPLINELKKDECIECVVVNTAQHREMLDQVLRLFSIKPNYDLNIMKENQTPEEIISAILTKLSEILDKEKPDLVLVHGDTSTTFTGALASFLKKIPVGHVEAGLRTYEMYTPFPEEVNRQLVSRLASLHFASTMKNKENLVSEHIKEESIAVVGNTVIDALLHVTSKPFEFPPLLESFLNNGKRTILMTTHRRENLGQLKSIYDGVNQILEKNQDVQILFPLHKNPIVRKEVEAHLMKSDRVLLIEPLDYETFSHTMKKSFLVLTDSGGIQEEAPALGIPVLVARNSTERQEGVDSGILKLVGTSPEQIFLEAHRLLNDEAFYQETSKIKNPYGNGTTSKQIISFIKTWMSS